jgi:hypothetical protein
VKPRTISNEVLKRAWHSPAPAFVIATELGIEEKNLTRRWLRLKREGVIPKGHRDTRRSLWSNRRLVRALDGDDPNAKSKILTAITEEFLRRLRQEQRLCR